ncbi:unnamed protein product [Paramecium sonneborni]|uniref:Transmembrane protein n=1 Tax=Paramecium sonneborni TaxID=65129 RepID=A0A8S1KSF1_9CILI|nr:unnamed protein product [Paramecium sonneborni]
MEINYTILIIALVIQIVLTFYQISYLCKLNRKKNHYPLKQLSAKITTFLGVFLILSQITSILLNTMVCCGSEGPINWGSYLLTFFYTFSRGCCYSFALIKTARIVYAFNKTLLNSHSLLVKYFSNEEWMIFTGFIYSIIGFTLLSFLTTKYNLENKDYTPCLQLQYYHDNNEFIMINSILEEVLYLTLMHLIIKHHLDDKLYKLTLRPLFIYMGWFICVSLILKIFNNNDDVEIIMGITYLFRAYVMFYFYIIKPLRFIEKYPTLYINPDRIENFEDISKEKFQGHYKDSFILSQFEEYLNYLDQNQDINYTFEGTEFQKIQLYQIYLELRKKISLATPNDLVIDYLNKQFQNNEILRNLSFQPEIMLEKLEKHLKDIYLLKFKYTKAFYTIKEVYINQEITIKNFEKFGIDLIEYDPLL